MSLDLNPRQRAMLREIGVRVWQPQAVASASAAPLSPRPAVPSPSSVPPAAAALAPQAPAAIDLVAGRARSAGATGSFQAKSGPAPTPTPRDQPQADSGSAGWRLGEAQALYADASPAPGAGPRWLVLAESAAAALAAPFKPFEGDAGKLLDNMLRAARRQREGSTLLAPLVRPLASGAAADAAFSADLSALLVSVQPDLVLVMGRLAAQALLQSSEPLGKLRGQIHSLHGIKTVVTIDAAYLLRNQGDKAKAWDDLCLAVSVV